MIQLATYTWLQWNYITNLEIATKLTTLTSPTENRCPYNWTICVTSVRPRYRLMLLVLTPTPAKCKTKKYQKKHSEKMRRGKSQWPPPVKPASLVHLLVLLRPKQLKQSPLLLNRSGQYLKVSLSWCYTHFFNCVLLHSLLLASSQSYVRQQHLNRGY